MTTLDVAEGSAPPQSTETATISRLDSGVVLFEPIRGVRVTKEDVVVNNRTILAAAGDGPVLLLARMTNIAYMDREAREYSARYADRHYRKVALVVESAVSRMLASFFLGFNKPEVPTKPFGDISSATAWLLEEG